MDLQTALRAVLPRLEPRAAAPVLAPQPMPKKRATARKAAPAPRRLAVGSFDYGRKVWDTTGEVGRASESRPPPRHAPSFSEFRCAPPRTDKPAMTLRQQRLWAKNEIK